MYTFILLGLLLASPPVQDPGGSWEQRWSLTGLPLDQFGFDFDPAVDLNGDGWSEILVGATGMQFPLSWRLGGAILVDGRHGNEFWRFLPPNDYHYNVVGYSVSIVPDLDGDGYFDCLVSDVGHEGAEIGTGSVFVLNGLTSGVIHEHFGGTIGTGSSTSGENFGWSVIGIEDVTGDGRGDYVISSPRSDLGQGTNSNNGEVECFSGATGSLVWRYSGQPNEVIGKALSLGPDLTGDLIPDILVDASGAFVGSERLGKVFLLDARTGNWLRTIDGLPAPQLPSGPSFGSSLGISSHLDADDIPDIIVGAYTATTAAGSEAGYVAAFSGSSGQLLWRFDSQVPGVRLGASVSGLDDLDLDGFTEVLVSGTGISTYHSSGIGQALVLSGKNGRPLWEIATSSAHYQGYGLGVRGYGRSGRLDHALISEPFLGNDVGAIHVVEFQPFLKPSGFNVSSSAGGVIHYEIDFPPSEAGHQFALLASAAGRGQTTLGGIIVPLARDAVFARCLSNQYPPFFLRPRGILDAQGDADAGLSISAGGLAGYVGRTVYLAAVTGSGGTGRLSSIAVPLTITP
jgi:hypothetical protein